MAEYDIALSAVADRSSWGYLTRRNIIITGGDDFTITLTVYEDEDASAPINTTGAWALLSVFDVRHWGESWWSRCWDYGFGGWGNFPRAPLLSIYNDGITDLTAGQFTFEFPPADTQNLRGRFAFVIEYEANGAGATIVRGIIEIRPGTGASFPARHGFVLDDGSGDGSSLDGPDSVAP